MPLSSSVNSSDSRYSIQSIASLGRPSHCGLMHHGCMLEFRCPTNYNFMLHLVQVRWVASNWSTTGPVMCHALWWCWAHHWCHQQHRWICAAVSGRCVRALPCPPSLQGWVLCILGHHGHRGHVVDKHRTQRRQFCQHLRWQVPHDQWSVSVTFPTCMLVLTAVSSLMSTPESVNPRLNLQLCQTRRHRWLHQDCRMRESPSANPLSWGYWWCGAASPTWPSSGGVRAPNWSWAKACAAAR